MVLRLYWNSEQVAVGMENAYVGRKSGRYIGGYA